MQKQKGMTFIGLVIVIAAGVALVVLGMQLMPAYLEFMTVKKAIDRIANDSSFNEMSKKQIIEAFSKSASIDNIRVIGDKDLMIGKDETGNVVSVEYQVTIPIVANASVLLDFKATSAK